MAEIGKATVKIVPDASGFGEALSAQIGDTQHQDGARLFFNVLTLLLLVTSPALVWAVYG